VVSVNLVQKDSFHALGTPERQPVYQSPHYEWCVLESPVGVCSILVSSAKCMDDFSASTVP